MKDLGFWEGVQIGVVVGLFIALVEVAIAWMVFL